jgi:hypothetical protein
MGGASQCPRDCPEDHVGKEVAARVAIADPVVQPLVGEDPSELVSKADATGTEGLEAWIGGHWIDPVLFAISPTSLPRHPRFCSQ